MKTDNKAKYANNLFLIIVLLTLVANIFVSLLSIKKIEINIIANLLLSQMIILIPGLIFYVKEKKDDEDFKLYKKIKPLSVILLVIITWLLMPLVIFANAFSQLFTTNTVMDASSQLLDHNIVLMVLIIGFFGPFCEEFVFRGLIYKNIRIQSGRYLLSALVSAFFFGFMHMNLNQFCYALVLGIAFAIISEALDNTWASFVCHAIVNTQNTIMVYLMNVVMQEIQGMGVSEYYGTMQDANGGYVDSMKIMMLVMAIGALIIGVITTALAGLLLYGICSIEGTTDRFKNIFKKKDKPEREKVVFATGIIAMSICIFVMFLLEPIIEMLK